MAVSLDDLIEALDAPEAESVGTSVRLPGNLRRAAALAVELGLVASTTELTVAGLRAELDRVARAAAIDAHYAQHPELRPSLAQVACAAAEIAGDPLAERPDLITLAAQRLVTLRPDADPDAVLIFAAALASLPAA